MLGSSSEDDGVLCDILIGITTTLLGYSSLGIPEPHLDVGLLRAPGFATPVLSLGGILLTTAELVRQVLLAQMPVVLGAGPSVLAASTGDLVLTAAVFPAGRRLAAKPRHGRDPEPRTTGLGNELARGPSAHGDRRRHRVHWYAGAPRAG